MINEEVIKSILDQYEQLHINRKVHEDFEYVIERLRYEYNRSQIEEAGRPEPMQLTQAEVMFITQMRLFNSSIAVSEQEYAGISYASMP